MGRKVDSGLPLLRDVAGQHAPSSSARQGSQMLSAGFCIGGEPLVCRLADRNLILGGGLLPRQNG